MRDRFRKNPVTGRSGPTDLLEAERGNTPDRVFHSSRASVTDGTALSAKPLDESETSECRRFGLFGLSGLEIHPEVHRASIPLNSTSVVEV